MADQHAVAHIIKDVAPAAGGAADPTATPDFLCIGAQKTATTWLSRLLRQNKNVFIPPMKEVHYFNHVHVRSHRPWAAKLLNTVLDRFDRREDMKDYVAGIRQFDRDDPRWYSAVFEHPRAEGKVKGEITPAYAVLPKAGVEQVYAMNPDCKILFIVRDPIDRAVSHLRMIAKKREAEIVDEAFVEGNALVEGAIARSKYRQVFETWRSVFPDDQFMTLFFPDIAKRPEKLLARVEDFLGVPHVEYDGAEEKKHVSKKLPVSAGVMAMLEEELLPERAYLTETFGPGWVDGMLDD
ncbi:MAG: sulfotransferase [Pseudomonadota bacterium]